MTNYSLAGLAVNLAYGAYNIIAGLATQSRWLFTVGTYYILLSAIRFAVLRTKKCEKSVQRFSGIMLMIMSVPLAGTVVLAYFKDRGTDFHEIVMITIAVYTFTKITLAIINLVKSSKSGSTKMITLRNISFADALVSVFSLQRSMLVSFEGMTETGIRIMNMATGTFVCILVLELGINLLLKSKTDKRI